MIQKKLFYSLFFLYLFSLFFLQICDASNHNNNYPIILVQGFAGWSTKELGGYKYFGGMEGDFEAKLKQNGHQVFTASVGPFSSNWDRACELYAQIKGGRVDYGENHSRKHGHERFGRTFPGLFPQWGTKINGEIQKVHLIGHSMGGQTIRMLAQLLATGTKNAPDQEDPNAHELFKGGKEEWIHSITTISSPNQGTLLSDALYAVGDMLENVVGGLFSFLGTFGNSSTCIFDAKLDHWNLAPRQQHENLVQYVKRIFKSGLFQPGFKDISLYSLSVNGTREQNTWVHTLPSIYYFSYANVDTFQGFDYKKRPMAYPNVRSMLLPFQPIALFLGSRFDPDKGYDEKWQPNDGVVNTISMISDGKGKVLDYESNHENDYSAGQWYKMGTLEKMDHAAMIGSSFDSTVYPLYEKHAKLLNQLSKETFTSKNKLRL